MEQTIHMLANKAFEKYDFQDASVEETSGWEYTTGEAQISRPIFLKFPEDKEEDDTHLAHFVVYVKDNRVEDAYCHINGNEVGHFISSN